MKGLKINVHVMHTNTEKKKNILLLLANVYKIVDRNMKSVNVDLKFLRSYKSIYSNMRTNDLWIDAKVDTTHTRPGMGNKWGINQGIVATLSHKDMLRDSVFRI